MTPDNWPETPDQMRALSPEEFEEFVGDVWSARGFDTSVTQVSNDAGKDVLAKKNGRRVAIQAKRYGPSNRVGGPEVQQYSSLLHDETIDDVVIVSSGSFTNAAYRRAQEIGIELVDGDRLLTLADRYASSDASAGESESKSTSKSSDQETHPIVALMLLPVKLTVWMLAASFKLLYLLYVYPLKVLFGSNNDAE